MKNKQHEYIMKAFLTTPIPVALQRRSSDLISIDSVVGGYCTQLVKGAKYIRLLSNEIITRDEKSTFSKLINEVTGMEKTELIVYYRLAILVESILLQYQQ